MTAILATLLVFVVAGIIWLANKGLEWWWIAAGSVVILVFILFSFLAYRKVAIERDEAKSELIKSDISSIAILSLHTYGDERTPTQISNNNIWRWYYLRFLVSALKEEETSPVMTCAMTTIFLSFDRLVKVGTLEVHSPDFTLPTHEVKEFNSRFAIISFSGSLPMGTLEFRVS